MGVDYLRPECCSGAGGADGAVAGKGDGQTPGPVLAGLVLTHQPALYIRHSIRTYKNSQTLKKKILHIIYIYIFFNL